MLNCIYIGHSNFQQTRLNFLQNNAKTYRSNTKERNHSDLISLFALVGMYITAVMGVVGFFSNNIVLTSALFLASFVYFIGYYIYKKFKNIELCSTLIIYSLYLFMFYLVYSGGVENTGPLWIFIVAPVSVFIHGLKRGLVNLALFLAIISVIMFLLPENAFQATYTTAFKLRLIYSFLTVTFLSALYEYSRDQSYKQTLELSEKYHQLAHFDPLTQLSNRRDALRILKHEQARIRRNNEPLSVILCDVDHFKKVNDKYGHNAGDAVLVELSKILSDNIREQDCIARWGGEEFLFILPQTLAINAHVFAEKIHEKMQTFVVNYEGEKIKVTISMGIEQLNGDQSIDEVINSADKYLYQAKKQEEIRYFHSIYE